MILIKNGTVKTMAGPDIEHGDVLIDGKKIIAVGKDLDIGPNTKIVDATGLLVTPGLIECHSHVGIKEEGNGAAGVDHDEKSDPITPEMRAIDGFNPMDIALKESIRGGVTTAVVGPGSVNVIGGTYMAVKMYGNRVDEMIIKDPVAMKVALGQTPKEYYGALKKTPMTRMGIAALLRTTLKKACDYNTSIEKANGDSSKVPKYDPKLEALLPVVRKEIPLKAHAHRSDDIFTAIRIANEFNLDIIIVHGTDGHLIAEELKNEGKPILVGPILFARGRDDLRNLDFRTAGILAKAGCEICITTDATVIQQELLSVQAGINVKFGLPIDDAWKAITINPARVMGIDDLVGSLEKGKDADLVIFKGNPLKDLGCVTMATFINGELVYRDPSFKSLL